MGKLVAVHILLLLGADTHTLVNSQGHSASALSESLLQVLNLPNVTPS